MKFDLHINHNLNNNNGWDNSELVLRVKGPRNLILRLESTITETYASYTTNYTSLIPAQKGDSKKIE